jgi:CheY-like chemotaxis protein
VAADPILVVDDNSDTRDALRRVLQIRGHPVVTARDGRDALAYLRGGGPASLIVLDLYMPRVDGRRFRAAQLGDPGLAHIPVIVFSVAVGETLPDVVGFVRKNDPLALLSRVEQVLGNAA